MGYLIPPYPPLEKGVKTVVLDVIVIMKPYTIVQKPVGRASGPPDS